MYLSNNHVLERGDWGSGYGGTALLIVKLIGLVSGGHELKTQELLLRFVLIRVVPRSHHLVILSKCVSSILPSRK